MAGIGAGVARGDDARTVGGQTMPTIEEDGTSTSTRSQFPNLVTTNNFTNSYAGNVDWVRGIGAVIMLQATRDIRKVALWLGHADIRTTEIYLRVDPSEKFEAVEAVLPLGLRRGRFKASDALIASLFDPG